MKQGMGMPPMEVQLYTGWWGKVPLSQDFKEGSEP